MKFSSFLTLIISISLNSIGQTFEGEWNGTFESNFNKFTNITITSPIKLYFKLNMDSSYTVYSYSKGQNSKKRDTTIVCKVDYKFVGKDSIYLEEVEILKPEKVAPTCLQKMKLKIVSENDAISLHGSWNSDGEECGSGSIRFRKKKKK